MDETESSRKLILAAPYTFCAYGYPMIYPITQTVPDSLLHSKSQLGAMDIQLNGNNATILDLESAIAFHAKGGTFEVLQAMTMIARFSQKIDTGRLMRISESLGSERQTGFLVEVCNTLFRLEIKDMPLSEKVYAQTAIPNTFSYVLGTDLTYGNQELNSYLSHEKQPENIASIEKKWGILCLLSAEELGKPADFVKYLVPNFNIIIDRKEMYLDLVQVLDILESRGIRCLLSGGMAVSELIYPCTSPDVDIVLERPLSGESRKALLELASQSGLILVLETKTGLLLERRNSNGMVHSIDICYSEIYDKPVQKSAFDNAIKMGLPGFERSVNVMSVEDLITLRLGSGRCKAIEDAQAAAQRGLVDWTIVFSNLAKRGELEGAMRDILLVNDHRCIETLVKMNLLVSGKLLPPPPAGIAESRQKNNRNPTSRPSG